MSRGHKRPPLIHTEKTPEDIIGMENIPLLELHFSKSERCSSTEEHERALGKMSDYDRMLCAEIYGKLRDNGYYPIRRDKVGNIVFGQALMGELQLYVESLPLPTRGERNE